jgi:hypothetical protein
LILAASATKAYITLKADSDLKTAMIDPSIQPGGQ